MEMCSAQYREIYNYNQIIMVQRFGQDYANARLDTATLASYLPDLEDKQLLKIHMPQIGCQH